MDRRAVIISAIAIGVLAAVVSGYSTARVTLVERELAEVQAQVAASLDDERLAAIERAVTDVVGRQDRLTTGFQGIRAQFGAIVGTDTGIVPAGTPTLIELSRQIDAQDQQELYDELLGDILSIQSCLRDMERAINTGGLVSCYFF